MRRVVTCQQCGTTFEAVRSDARYCGAACRQQADRGVPPRPPRAQQPRGEQWQQPPPRDRLDTGRVAWLGRDGNRVWFRMKVPGDKIGKTVIRGPGDPRHLAHEELGQYWVGASAFWQLRDALAAFGCRIIEVEAPGPLPPLFLLELADSDWPVARGLYNLLLATPPSKWRRLVRSIAGAAHPDGTTSRRPAASDELLKLALALLDDPEL